MCIRDRGMAAKEHVELCRFQRMPADLHDSPGPAKYVSPDCTHYDQPHGQRSTVLRHYSPPRPHPRRKVWSPGGTHERVHDRAKYGEMPYSTTLSGTACLPNKAYTRAGRVFDAERKTRAVAPDRAWEQHARELNASASHEASTSSTPGGDCIKSRLPWFCGRHTDQPLQSYAATIYNRQWNKVAAGEYKDAIHNAMTQTKVDHAAMQQLHHVTYNTPSAKRAAPSSKSNSAATNEDAPSAVQQQPEGEWFGLDPSPRHGQPPPRVPHEPVYLRQHL
eukprot:TRINITY_DN13380_c0_g1_i2.p1 TRINITY_DN13380_c0_g1~~TRINITY_DN13380_c0_g1_i2.p1  ORF type:complete len:277 (-),score=55.34 TRINITY_DN13380_c0_g1_i2:45-875(-)